MIRPKWSVFAATAACVLIAAVVATSALAAPPAHVSPSIAVPLFSGVTLSGTSPNGTCMTSQDYAERLNTLKSVERLGKTVRIRSTSECQALVELVPAAIAAGITVNANLLAVDRNSFAKEKATLETALRRWGSDWLSTVSVGSESLYRKEIPSAQLAEQIWDIKDMVQIAYRAGTVPVGTSDTWASWDDPENALAIRASDFLGLNAFPYWQGVPIEQALNALQQAVQVTAAASNGKPIIVTETGWPSAGPSFGDAEASLANEEEYFNQAVSWLRLRQLPYIWFSGWDEPQQPESEKSWGLFTSDGTPKFPLDR